MQRHQTMILSYETIFFVKVELVVEFIDYLYLIYNF